MRESFKKAVDFLGQDEGVPKTMHGAFHDMAGRAATYHEMGGRTVVARTKANSMGVNGTELRHTIVSAKEGTEPHTEEHHLYKDNAGMYVHSIAHPGGNLSDPHIIHRTRGEANMMAHLYTSHTLD